MIPPPTAVEEPTTPTPPRYRWLARGTVAVLCSALLLIAVRAWWAAAAQRRLDAVVAVAHARGEPATTDDFTDPAVPADPPNAAALLRSAGNAIALTRPQLDWLDRWSPELTLDTADLATRAQIVATNAGPLTLARLAVDVPAAQWQVRLPRPAVAVNCAALVSRQRQVATLLEQAAEVDLDAGDGAATTLTWRAMVRQSDALSTAWPQMSTHLNAGGILSTAVESIVRHAAALPVADVVARVHVQRLIRQLLDETAFRDGGRRAWYAERLNGIDLAADPAAVAAATPAFATTPATAGGNPVVAAALWTVRPLVTMDAVRLFGDDTAFAAAADRPTWPAARAVLPPPPAPLWSNLSTAESVAWNTFLWTWPRVVETDFHNRTDRRAAAVLLAIRLFAADHGGRLPATLDALVPTYLPAVPADPMSPAGGPLRYVAGTNAGAVYSLGSDGVDDGGSTVSSRSARGRSTSRWETKDAVYPYGPPAGVGP